MWLENGPSGPHLGQDALGVADTGMGMSKGTQDSPTNESNNPTHKLLPARVHDTLPGKLLLLPVQVRPFFPAQTMPIVLPESLWRETVERVGNTPQQLVGLILARPNSAPLTTADFRPMGTVVRMRQPLRNDGYIQFIAEGIHRFRVLNWTTQEPPFVAEVEYPEPPLENSQEVRAYALAIIAKIRELLQLNPFYQENVKSYLERFSPDEASPLADFAAALSSAASDDLQDVLETVPLLRRMEKVMLLIQREVALAGPKPDSSKSRRAGERAAAGIFSARATQGNSAAARYFQRR